jgi:CheY-like chemotaxis protein
MAKIMLVEDDKNLSAIYKDRLLAEGYEIVLAHDGEEALALAVKEKPNLIVADVMMPKISGFDMLDILRSTPETKNTKVIMMTALSQAEDQQRATQLGANKYLVKSQVTLDDVARVVKEVLSETTVSLPHVDQLPQAMASEAITSPEPVAASAPLEPTTAPEVPIATEPPTTPMPEMPASVTTPTFMTPEVASLPAEPVAQEKSEIEHEIEQSAEQLPVQAPAEIVTPESQPEPQKQGGERVIEPVTNSEVKPDIMSLYEQEMAKETTSTQPIPTQPPQATPPVEQPINPAVDPHSSISL